MHNSQQRYFLHLATHTASGYLKILVHSLFNHPKRSNYQKYSCSLHIPYSCHFDFHYSSFCSFSTSCCQLAKSSFMLRTISFRVCSVFLLFFCACVLDGKCAFCALSSTSRQTKEGQICGHNGTSLLKVNLSPQMSSKFDANRVARAAIRYTHDCATYPMSSNVRT